MANDNLTVSIPRGELPVFKSYISTDLKTLDSIVNALETEPPALGANILSRPVAEKTGIDQTIIEPIVTLAIRLALVRRRINVDMERFLEILDGALHDFGPIRWTPKDSEEWNARKELLKRLIDPLKPVALAAKARDLIMDQHATFCRARIISDVRPVFDESGNNIHGFVPFHTLKITMHEGPEDREMHITMDLQDIKELQTILERAVQKEKEIKLIFSEKGIPIYRTEVETR